MNSHKLTVPVYTSAINTPMICDKTMCNTIVQFQSPLQHATLIKRYKRFLADVTLPNGETLTIYCPNTGKMTGCATAGDTVWFSTSNNPKRKYQHTWELTYTQRKEWICVNTLRANELVLDALKAR